MAGIDKEEGFGCGFGCGFGWGTAGAGTAAEAAQGAAAEAGAAAGDDDAGAAAAVDDVGEAADNTRPELATSGWYTKSGICKSEKATALSSAEVETSRNDCDI